MTLAEALTVFDVRADPFGFYSSLPECCGVAVVENSQEGVSRITCMVCGRQIREVAGQWIIGEWGSKGIQMPIPERLRRQLDDPSVWAKVPS